MSIFVGYFKESNSLTFSLFVKEPYILTFFVFVKESNVLSFSVFVRYVIPSTFIIILNLYVIIMSTLASRNCCYCIASERVAFNSCGSILSLKIFKQLHELSGLCSYCAWLYSIQLYVKDLSRLVVFSENFGLHHQ